MIIAVNFPISAIGKKKPEKNQGFNGTRTRDLCVTGVLFINNTFFFMNHRNHLALLLHYTQYLSVSAVAAADW